MMGFLTMNNTFLLRSGLVILGLVGLIVAQPIASSQTSTSEANSFLRLSDVREGMRGKSKTVFRGTEPEAFDVEILGVVPGAVGPKQDLIIGRISGGQTDRTGVFAGMSGSPVYIDGKLVGAISYSFPFSKEAICGITPIEQMVAIFQQKSSQNARTEPRSFSFAEMVSVNETADLLSFSVSDSSRLSGMSPNSMLMVVAGQTFRPIATPITFSGFSQATLDKFSPQLVQAGLLPVAAAGGSSAIAPMKKADADTLMGGRSVSMHLARGDYGLAAAGTVTFRDGSKVYAFGHSFLGLGTSDLAMSESHVVVVVPSINNSFKLAVPDSMVGSMTQDRATGVFGNLGTAPKMIPVKLSLTTSRGQDQTLSFEIARDETLTPLLLNIAIFNSIIAQERSVGDSTIYLDGAIRLKEAGSIRLQRRFSGAQSVMGTAIAVSTPAGALLRGQFSDLEFEGIDINLRIDDGSRIATLERIAVDRVQVKAGDTLDVQAFVRTPSGSVFVEKIPVKIGADTAAGNYSVTIGDGSSIQKSEATQQFVPKNLAEMIGTINRLRMPDRLYAKNFRSSTGAIIGTNEMPNLPPSVLATLNNDRMTGGVKPAMQTVVKIVDVPPAKFIIFGEQTLTFEVIK